jgi:membrane protein implicated in regulation of membrane protease activity
MMPHFSLPQSDGEPAVRRLLEAHQRYARMSGAKTFALHLLAVVSVALWIGAMWPAILPPVVLDDALGIWLALLLFAVLASAEEWIWRRRVAQYQRQRNGGEAAD